MTITIFQSIVLGIVQGLTELLPISSTAHLEAISWTFDWNIPRYFDIALHFGTFLAILMFFFKDWIKLIIGGFKQIVKKEKSTEGKMFWYLVLATIPGGAIGYICEHYIDKILTEKEILSMCVIATSLIVFGILLYFVDKKSKTETQYENMTLKQTFLIGISQAIAFIPGVSRSGITMTTARFMKVDRASAARFSFMLSAPITLGAVVFKLKDFVFNISFLVGVLTSFIVGIFVIKFLLEYLKKGSFKLFAVYRVVVGLLIFGLIFV